MSKTGWWCLILTVVLGLILAGGGYFAWLIVGHGFSASETPSQLEEFLARHARRIATPQGAKQLKNPIEFTSEDLAAARAHWVDHCASCHALNGSGDTVLGRNIYPPAPDMRTAVTQDLTDGELFYIITNGVRFTGMPAWGGQHSDKDTWQLVAFIRRLPTLSPEELELMEQLGVGKSAGAGHIHEPGAKPHAH